MVKILSICHSKKYPPKLANVVVLVVFFKYKKSTVWKIPWEYQDCALEVLKHANGGIVIFIEPVPCDFI